MSAKSHSNDSKCMVSATEFGRWDLKKESLNMVLIKAGSQRLSWVYENPWGRKTCRLAISKRLDSVFSLNKHFVMCGHSNQEHEEDTMSQDEPKGHKVLSSRTMISGERRWCGPTSTQGLIGVNNGDHIIRAFLLSRMNLVDALLCCPFHTSFSAPLESIQSFWNFEGSGRDSVGSKERRNRGGQCSNRRVEDNRKEN